MSVPAYRLAQSGLGLGSKLANYAGATGTGSALGDAASALGIYGGLQRGGVQGYGQAALSAGKLAGNLGYLPSGANSALGAGSNLLGIYSGLQQGGWQGNTKAGLSAAQLGSQLGMLPSSVGQYAGYAAIPLAAYNFIQNDTASGKTGQDALGGAQSGAEIGTAILPGVGTLVGAGLGAVGGALASAFGPGAKDPESDTWASYASNYNKMAPTQQKQFAQSVQDPYTALAGLMDLRSIPGGNIPIYDQYGRAGEQKFVTDMTEQINSALQQGKISKDSSSQEIMQKVVSPWVQSFGKGTNTDINANALSSLLGDMVGQYKSGAWTQDWKPVGGQDVSSTFGNVDLFGTGETLNQYDQSQHPQGTAPRIAPGTSAAHGVNRMAKGGSTRSRLRKLYEGSFAARKRFQEGGPAGYYANYTMYLGPSTSNPSTDYSGYVTQPTSGFDYNAPPLSSQTLQNPSDYLTNYIDPNTSTYDPNLGPTTGNVAPAGDVTSTTGAGGLPSGPSGGGGGSTNSITSALQSLFGGSGTGSGSNLGGALQLLQALSPLIGAATKPSNAAQPSPSQGYQQISPIATPTFQRQYSQPNVANWYTYGQGPEQSFFKNNQLPTIPGVSPSTTNAATPTPNMGNSTGWATMQPVRPGGLSTMAQGGAAFDSTQGDSYVQDPGHGDGTSDDIDARLSGGEYVMDAGTVSMLGNGSNEAGSRALDQLRQRVRKHAGKKLVKGKQFMKAKAPGAYLKKGAGE